MGSAITFSDKIASKNCQNLADLGEEHASSSSSASSECANGGSDCDGMNGDTGPSSSDNHCPCCCFLQDNHVELNCRVCEYHATGYEDYLLEHRSNHPCSEEQMTEEEEDGEGSGTEMKEEDEDVRESRKSTKKGPPRESLLTALSNCIMVRRCLCDSIKPILKLSQLLGVVPLNLKHEKNSEGEEDIGSCELTFRWKSLSTFLNTSFILFFLLISPIAHSEVRDRMIIVLSGTDLYAFSLQTVAMVLETTILLTVGRLYQKSFSRGWASLNEVFHAICDTANDLQQIRLGSYITALIIMIEGAGFFLFMYWTSHRIIGVYQSCSALLIGTFVISLTLIIPYIMSTLFFFICLLIRSHFLKISEMLKTVVSKQKSPKMSSKIDTLRVLHEQLCQTVTYFEDFFGFQVLLTLCTCCFTVTVGAYACIQKGEDSLSSPQGRELTGAWGMQLLCAGVFILLILISGQLVTNAAASPGQILNAIPLSELDERSQIQITAFLNKISAFPTKMSAVKITTISTTFLASAATNITTYLLVLMQFKLSVENRFDDDAENLTIPTAGLDLDASTEPIFYNVSTPESMAFLTESL